MGHRFAEIAFTPKVKAWQERLGSRQGYLRLEGAAETHGALGPQEAAFIAQRDSFYMASVGENGWPYVQHRGGPKGFLRAIDAQTIAFADFRGNRQYISAGNLEHDGRVSLIMVDYANRARLKLLGRARTVEAADDPGLMEKLALPGYPARVERAVTIAVEAFDWNCPQHITPRYSMEEIEIMVEPLAKRIAELEAERDALKAGG